jgi:carboxymethylenebutenolidase
MDGAPRGGVIVIHHMPGYDAATQEITGGSRRSAITRSVPTSTHARRRAPTSTTRRPPPARRGVPDERFVGDVDGAARWLRSLPTSNGRVGTIGFCSGGRQSVLAAIEVDVQAAIDCYGAFVVGTPPEGFPLQVGPLDHRIGELRAPLLGLFGNDDSYPSPAQVDELEKLLQDTARSTSSTPTTTPATPSSPSTARATASPPPSTAGSGSPTSSRATSPPGA